MTGQVVLTREVPVPPEPRRDAPGGPRLQPAHYEPGHVPVEVARYGSEPGGLPVGAPGKVGVLELDFALRGEPGAQRTELVHHYQKTPLQIMRPLYYDPLRADMPFTYVMTTGGGILHNDRQRTDVSIADGASAHLTTQAHTKAYRMETGFAAAVVNLEVGAGSYLEYLPDPVILFADSRFYQRTAVRLHPQGTLVAGETIYVGRLSRGERNEFTAFASDFEVRRPDGSPVAFDRARLVPRGGQLGGPGVLGGRDVVTTLYALTPLVPARTLADALLEAASAALADHPDQTARFGVSTLPGETGAWLRYVGDDTVSSTAVHRAAAAAVHELLTGLPAPLIRK